MLSVRPERPVAPLTIAVMREVDAVTQELGLEYFLCGAIARDLLLTHVHGIELGTATEDVDFGVAVNGWEQFEGIKARLNATGNFVPVGKVSQRLLYKPAPSSSGCPVDFIPFGGVETSPNRIEWPPDRSEVLNVIACKEVLGNAVRIRVENELIIPTSSLPGLALLKLFAWVDRGHANPKDAQDLAILLRKYAEAGNRDRLYSEEIGLFERAGHDESMAGPELMGKDAGRIASSATLIQAIAILDDTALSSRLALHMAPRLRDGIDDPIEVAERLLDRFRAGLGGADTRPAPSAKVYP